MEMNSLNSAADLSSSQREVIESIVGRPLDAQDMVFLAIFRAGQEPAIDEKARARAGLEQVFRQIDHFGQGRGIDPDEADAAIDEAARDVRHRTS
jgi:hypothetical protein